MDVLRTPDEAFTAVPDWDHPVSYVEVPALDGSDAAVRVAYVDVGPRDGEPVLCLHGEPSWGFLYRHVATALAEAGLRVIVPDLVGFGRSDKPALVTDHTYERHVAWMIAALLDDGPRLSGVTLLCQDWGGLIGLRMLTDRPEHFARVVAANTGLPNGTRRMPDVWWRFHDFVTSTPSLPIGFLVDGGTARTLSDAERLAYEAPFPDATYQAGPHAMPGLIPQEPDAPSAAENVRAWSVLTELEVPFVTAFSDADPITRGSEVPLQQKVRGAQGEPHVTLPGGHFLQEDCPRELAQVVVDLVRRHPR
ncbi:MAG TPA: haloalkane dehalogenase [Mycobacteriales bacterium]|nr:haloalkane dehalogenase [Mycobacteriales bacterium]